MSKLLTKTAIAALAFVSLTTSTPTSALTFNANADTQAPITKNYNFGKTVQPRVKPQQAISNPTHKSTIDGPVWFEEAMKWIGTTELKGQGKSNPTIEKMHNSTRNAVGASDATAWCASFVNWVLKTTAEKHNLPSQYKGTGSAGARHFFSIDRYKASKNDKRYSGWGKNVSVKQLAVGDLATIIWNRKSNKGHVGFVVGTHLSADGSIDGIWILGGNQRNQTDKTEAVTVSLYGLGEAALMEFKRIKGFQPKASHYVKAYSKQEAKSVFGKNIGKRGSLKGSR